MASAWTGREAAWVTRRLPPGVCQKYERELAPLDGIGLSADLMDQVVTMVVNMATGTARWELLLDRGTVQRILVGPSWWALSLPVLASAMRGMELPVSARVGTTLASAGDPHASVPAGTELLVSGLRLVVSDGRP